MKARGTGGRSGLSCFSRLTKIVQAGGSDRLGPPCAFIQFVRGRAPALAGIIGPALFWSVLTILGQTQPAHSAVRTDISLLALGAAGWAQTANFVAFGLLVAVFQGGLQQAVSPGKMWGWSRILALASGVGLVAIAVFPTDFPGASTTHGAVHLGIVFMLALLLPVVCFVIAGQMKRHSSWRGYARFTVLIGALTGGLTLMLLLAWSGAWPASHPWLGLYERTVFALPSIWMEIMAIRLMKNVLETRRRAA